jgi:hypothetical protein
MPFLAHIRAAATKAAGFVRFKDWPVICRAEDKPSQLNRMDKENRCSYSDR